jgi:hypothetical protein
VRQLHALCSRIKVPLLAVFLKWKPKKFEITGMTAALRPETPAAAAVRPSYPKSDKNARTSSNFDLLGPISTIGILFKPSRRYDFNH